MISNNSNTTIENIKNKLQIILDNKFSKDIYIKRKLDIYPDRINFACPYCSDSKSDIRKKRGNLYLDSLHYFCFNCGHSTGINRLLSDFGEDLSNEDKIVVHDIQQNSKKMEKRTVTRSQSSMSFTLLETLAVPKSIFFRLLGLISPYKDEYISGYLKSRMIDIRLWKYFAYSPEKKELYILNTTPEDRIIGYQIRQLDPSSKKARYMSYTLGRMYNDLFGKNTEGIIEKILEKDDMGRRYLEQEDGTENIAVNLDRLSGMFNIMNIDMRKTVTILEGPIDSLAIDNAIALQGASKQMNGFFDGMNNIRYIFDNDKTGKEMSIKKLKEHKKVFLWDMYIKPIGTKMKIKDINDLQRNGLLEYDKLERCFSDDEFDVMYI